MGTAAPPLRTLVVEDDAGLRSYDAKAHRRDLDYRVLPKPFSPELFEHAIAQPLL